MMVDFKSVLLPAYSANGLFFSKLKFSICKICKFCDDHNLLKSDQKIIQFMLPYTSEFYLMYCDVLFLKILQCQKSAFSTISAQFLENCLDNYLTTI